MVLLNGLQLLASATLGGRHLDLDLVELGELGGRRLNGAVATRSCSLKLRIANASVSVQDIEFLDTQSGEEKGTLSLPPSPTPKSSHSQPWLPRPSSQPRRSSRRPPSPSEF